MKLLELGSAVVRWQALGWVQRRHLVERQWDGKVLRGVGEQEVELMEIGLSLPYSLLWVPSKRSRLGSVRGGLG